MPNVMPFDELNTFKASLPQFFDPQTKKFKTDADLEFLLDMLEDLFLLAYANGVESVNSSLSSDIVPSLDDVMDVVDKKVEGKTWRKRVEDYFANGGTEADIVRIAETETHRDSNEAAYETAKKAGAKTKTWNCMMLPTSRDTHIYLDGVTAPIDGEFYSFKGGSTQFPGQWGIAEEDVNCLCWLTFE